MKRFYISVPTKFILAAALAIAWAAFSTYLAGRWITDLAALTNIYLSIFIISGIAILPGLMNAFLAASLLLDNRPKRKIYTGNYPPITILVAAYNEEANILSTLESISRQQYPGSLHVIVINDGSSDRTVEKVKSVQNKYPWLALLDIKKNAGKANALNQALKLVSTRLTITIDGDSYLYANALTNLVQRYLSDPEQTVAVAGAVLVRNSRKNLVCKVQEWDYFSGISAVKRLQSLYHGTLVAQGAFSLYTTAALHEVGGWPHCVGEDIVLTWAILRAGYRVGYAEDACLFTNAPETWIQFFKQRHRWSRGLMEAFKEHWKLLFKPRLTVIFIWWNLLFPYLDIVYTLAFIPGIILALFGYYWIAGPMTLIVMPMALMMNYLMYVIQSKMFTSQGLKVRRNPVGFIIYALLYSLILQPVCVLGYFKEVIAGSVKNWGTK